jgi:ABC-type glycerol-3-phosphate transport system substrate-binding protein
MKEFLKRNNKFKIFLILSFFSLAFAQHSKKQLNWIGHWLHEHDREVLVRKVAKEFDFIHPDIKLNLKFPQELMNFRSKPETARFYAQMIRSGNIDWDVIWLDDQIYQYVSEELKDPEWGKKHLVDFCKIKGFKETQKDFILKEPIYREQTGGIIVGPYLEGYSHAIYYNKDVAKKLGIKIKQYGMTFEDLLGYLKAVYDYNRKNRTKIGGIYESKDWISLEILFQYLVKTEIKDYKKAISESFSAKKKKAFFKTLKAFETLGKYRPLINSHAKNIWHDTRQIVLNDSCLFYINGIWMYNHWMSIDRNKTAKMIPCELPSFYPVNYYSGGFIPTWAVFKNAPNKESAIKLVLHWSSPQIAEKWTRYTKAPTGVKGNLSSADYGEHPFEQFNAKLAKKYGGNVHFAANTGYLFGEENRLLLKELKNKIIELLEKKTTAKSVYDEIMSKIDVISH